MTLPILYSFRRCPYAMRARMALDAARIKVEHREVLLRNKPEAMLVASPKGTVPVLVTDDDVIDESLDIMIWALSQSDPETWLRNIAENKATAEQFLEDFKDALDRYKYASRYDPNVARGDVDLNQRQVALKTLLDLASPLSSARFLDGEKPSLLDIATFPFVRQFAAVEPDWWLNSAPDSLQHWLTHFLESDRFARVMTKQALWSPDTNTESEKG